MRGTEQHINNLAIIIPSSVSECHTTVPEDGTEWLNNLLNIVFQYISLFRPDHVFLEFCLKKRNINFLSGKYLTELISQMLMER